MPAVLLGLAPRAVVGGSSQTPYATSLHVCTVFCTAKLEQGFGYTPILSQSARAASTPDAAPPPLSVRLRLVALLPPREAIGLMQQTWQLLCANFWPVIVIYALKDTAAFLLHRLGHRITNAVAEATMGVDIAAITNPWWLCLDSQFLEGNVAYQFIIAAVFMVCLPINILLNSYALAAIMQVVKQTSGLPGADGAVVAVAADAEGSPSSNASSGTPEVGTSGAGAGDTAPDAAAGQPTSSSSTPSSASSSSTGGEATAGCGEQPASSSSDAGGTAAAVAATPPKKGRWFGSLRSALSTTLSVTPSVNAMLSRVWWVDLQFNARALPLQALSLLVLPLFWTLPRLLAIQLAVPIAISEGLGAKAALERSAQLMAGYGRAYAWPYMSLLLGIRLLDALRTLVLTMMPPRFWLEVVEVPIALVAGFAFAKIVVIRLQDIMPAAAFGARLLPGAAVGDPAQEEAPVDTPPPVPPSL
ncbi:hypothetical protein FOA52_002540 [Chlamydomonas sp. UWO 241]|nr:hypothetical protein FOA52_002540 [Chlamydomonas sp. UWO 241]